MNKKDATHRIVYLTQARVEEFVKVNDQTGKVEEAGPALQIFKGYTISDIRSRKMVTKVEDLRLSKIDTIPKEERRVILTDEPVGSFVEKCEKRGLDPHKGIA